MQVNYCGMARQAAEIGITGTFGELCFYEMEGKYYLRLKSSLTGKRVKCDPKFKRTMELAGIFGMANKVASIFYNQLPGEEKGKSIRYELIGRVRKMIAEGMNYEAVLAALLEQRAEALKQKECAIKQTRNIQRKVKRPGVTRRRLRRRVWCGERMALSVANGRPRVTNEFPLLE